MIKLRGYQERIIEEVRGHLRAGKRRILIVLPTGGGKTVVAGFMARNAAAKGISTWFMAHRDFLVEQTYQTFEGLELEPGAIAATAKHWARPSHVQVCGVMTLVRRLDNYIPPQMRMWDEAHHAAAGSWKKIIDWCGGKGFDIGLTATPERLDGKGLGEFFEEMVLGPTVEELMAEGSLSRYAAYAPSMPDLSAVRKAHGDYNLADLDEVMDTEQLVGEMVRHYREKALGKRAVYFAVSIEASKHLEHDFRAAGIPAMHLDAESTVAERKLAAKLFATGEVQILTNVGLFGEGYDLAAQAGMPVTIDAVGLARPTQSLSLHLQQIGRALRPKADKGKAVILDHAGNIMKHGLPDDDRMWSLEGRKKKDAEASIKMCPACQAANPASAFVCMACGETLKLDESKERPAREGPVFVNGELEEIDKEKLAALRKKEEKGCKTLEDFMVLGAKRGYKPAWAQFRWKARQDYLAKYGNRRWA